MTNVVDRVVQYPWRFSLTDISTGTVLGTYDLTPITGTVTTEGTVINAALFASIQTDLNAKINASGGDASNAIVSFTQDSSRANLTSGEAMSSAFGKISKYFADLKAVAFSGNKADIGLGNVDNTADTDKPVSTATKEALDKKVDAVAGSSLMTDAEHNKLSGIADGAEVNVNADWNATSGDAVILNKPTIPTVPVQSVNAKTGAVVLTGSDIATSSADSEKLDSKSVANMLHLGAYDTYTYDVTTGKYTVTRKTTYNNDGTQSESSSETIETLSDRYFARTGQPYIEEWKKSEADRSSNLLCIDEIPAGELFNCTASFSNGILTINPSTRDPYVQFKRFSLKAGTYTISAYSTSAMQIIVFNLTAGVYTNNAVDTIGLNILTFTLQTDATIYIRIDGKEDGSVASQTVYNFMLNTGSVALPYQPYEGEVVHESRISNVDNTSDLDKPISTATQTAMNSLDSSLQVSIDQCYSYCDENIDDFTGQLSNCKYQITVRIVKTSEHTDTIFQFMNATVPTDYATLLAMLSTATRKNIPMIASGYTLSKISCYVICNGTEMRIGYFDSSSTSENIIDNTFTYSFYSIKAL